MFGKVEVSAADEPDAMIWENFELTSTRENVFKVRPAAHGSDSDALQPVVLPSSRPSPGRRSQVIGTVGIVVLLFISVNLFIKLKDLTALLKHDGDVDAALGVLGTKAPPPPTS